MKGTGKGRKGDGGWTRDLMPRHTLFVGGIDFSVKIDELRASLYELFSPYGDVIEIIATKTKRKDNRRRIGTAFIVFGEISQATGAKNSLNGIQFYKFPLRIDYSKTKSDATAIFDGTYKPRKSVEAQKAKFLEKRAKKEASKITLPNNRGKPMGKLLVENLPDDIQGNMLDKLFGQYHGFKETELIRSKNVAFISYETEGNALKARDGLDNFHISEHNKIAVSVAK